MRGKGTSGGRLLSAELQVSDRRPDAINQVLDAIIAAGGSLLKACQRLGLTTQTLSRLRRRDRGLNDAVLGVQARLKVKAHGPKVGAKRAGVRGKVVG